MNTAFIISPETAKLAAKHLRATDKVLGAVIEHTGLCDIVPHKDYYRALTSSIIGQQLSIKAAATIRTRFCALFDGDFPEPTAILTKNVDELRTAGLSRSKAGYILDLAQHIVDGKIAFDTIETMTNDEIIAMLTDVKGIGVWTVHMFLMFCMGRSDVLATGDLGVRSGIRKIYNLDHLPSPQEINDLAKAYQWHPYESIVCWYAWAALDNEPTIN